MVRVNLIPPRDLSDQHLIAEYNEIIMLVAYVKEHPKLEKIPKSYRLGKGHMKFFKNKLKYLKRRHEAIKKEMKRRGFKTRKTISLKGFPKKLLKDWRPKKEDKEIIKKRLVQKIKARPYNHRYRSKKMPKKFLIDLIKKAK